MTTYVFKARTGAGLLKENTINADSVAAARSKLLKQGFKVFFLEEEKGKPIYIGGQPKVKAMDLMMMTRQLTTLIRAGVPILTAITSLSRQVESITLQEALKKIEMAISGGKKLSESMSQHSKIFNSVYVNVVMAGEVGGVLPEVLERLANLIERDEFIKSEVKSALRYPTYVVAALGIAFVFLVNFVVPRFSEMFSRFELDLPLPTRILMFFSDTMKSHWYIYILSVIAMIIAFRMFKKSERGSYLLDKLKLRLPVVGTLILKFNMSRAANLMSTLIRSGVPVLHCLEIIKKTVDNKIIQNEFHMVKLRVESGCPIHEYMEESPVFPPMMTNMVKIGEDAGSLEQTLETVADHYEMETKYAVKTLTGMIEPLITIMTGIMVLGLALSIFLPMWDMAKVARGSG